MTVSPTIGAETPPLRRRSAVVVTIVSVLLLPLSVWVAFAATVATVMAVASGSEYGLTGFALVAVGLLLMATPILVLVALVVLWVALRRGRPRLAWRAVMVSLPLQVLGLVGYALLVTG